MKLELVGVMVVSAAACAASSSRMSFMVALG